MANNQPKSKRDQLFARYGIVVTVIAVVAVAIIAQMVMTTVVDADKWNNKADSLMNTVLIEQPKRGDILACDGSIIATTVTKYDISMDYRTSASYDTLLIQKLEPLSEKMAEHFPVRSVDEWRDYLAKPLAKKPKKRTRCHMLLKGVDYDDYELILTFPYFAELEKRRNKRYAHGLCCNPRDVRLRPYEHMARHSIGRCNYVRAPKFEGAKRRRDTIDVLRGYSGLEKALDSLLYGKPGIAHYETATKGVRRQVVDTPHDGYSVRTTIDIKIQDIVENELIDMVEYTGADWGTCILMEVETGDIKALSNIDLDPTTGKGIEAMNYAVLGYEPGSVMKPISMIVALEDKFAGLDQVYSIGSTYAYAGGAPIHDTHSPAALPMRRFIEYSSNIGMTKLIAPHYEGNLNGFRERLRELGFFDRFNSGLARERTPIFPTLDPKAGGRVSLSRMAYGYATMIPPLYTCAMYNAIANKGRFVRPRIYSQLIGRDGVVDSIPVSYVRDRILSEKNAKVLMEMLESVVYGEGGTAKSLRNDKVRIVGKTGTCRIALEAKRDSAGNIIKGGPIGYRDNHYRLAFCGIFPYENPKYTCMVLLSNPGPAFRGAATTSGTVVKNIALKLFSHGMLDKYSDYTQVSNPGTVPTLYACSDADYNSARSNIGAPKVNRMRRPATAAQGTVPDVRGLGLREVLARIEDAGYAIEAHGSGYAMAQSPAPGDTISPGAKIKVTFTTR